MVLEKNVMESSVVKVTFKRLRKLQVFVYLFVLWFNDPHFCCAGLDLIDKPVLSAQPRQMSSKEVKTYDIFILDFKKAFGTPPHELPKSKLFSYGIGGKTLKWIDSFLCFRQQRAVVNGVKLGSGFVGCPPRHRSWSLIIFLCT